MTIGLKMAEKRHFKKVTDRQTDRQTTTDRQRQIDRVKETDRQKDNQTEPPRGKNRK